MILSVTGLDHTTAPLEVRERLAFAEADLAGSLPMLRGLPGTAEALLLSTCNRTEAYLVSDHPPDAAAVTGIFAQLRGLDAAGCLPWMRVRYGDEAARHVLRVAAGLESMVVGEHQILGQVRRAFEAAQTAGAAGCVLNRLFQLAVATGRRVRRETGLSGRAASVPRAVAGLCRRELRGLRGRRILVVGAGEMAGLIVKVFAGDGATIAAVANRTLETARLLAARVGAVAAPLETVPEWSGAVDAVIVTVGAPLPVVWAADFAVAGARRAPLIVDIGVPRGVDPSVAALPGVRLRNLDDLGVTADVVIPPDIVQQAEQIIAAELDVFRRWLRARTVAPVIAALQRRAEQIAADELRRAHLGGLDAHQRDAVHAAVRGAMAKLLHTPIVRLKSTAADGEMVSLAQELFDLQRPDE